MLSRESRSGIPERLPAGLLGRFSSGCRAQPLGSHDQFIHFVNDNALPRPSLLCASTSCYFHDIDRLGMASVTCFTGVMVMVDRVRRPLLLTYTWSIPM